jgi:hypothetical protein
MGHYQNLRTAGHLLLLLVFFVFLGVPGFVLAQDNVFICPMDPDVRSNQPGTCRRCGMKLREGIPEPVEFHLGLTLTPRAAKPNQPEQLKFSVHDPWKDRPVTTFQIVHEKLFHMFVVSQDLQFFLHDHPVLQPNGEFLYTLAFPKPGMYRVLGDFYPDGATPQLIAKTVIVAGTPPALVELPRDYSSKQAENMQVEMTTDPPQPVATQKTLVYFRLTPADGLEKYIGAWAHMLAASDDLIDLIHTHPFIADGGPDMQFNVYFPREHVYRIWVQFQRNGVVNTAHFDLPVQDLK